MRVAWCSVVASSLAVLLALAPGASAQVGEAASGIRTPVRHTAGPHEQLMGHLSADGERIYFVSDRHVTLGPWVVDVRRGAPRRLFEHDGDVSAVRPAPDGKRLLFISYRDDALGDACIYTPGEETRCLTGPDTAEVQAFWFPDGRSVGVVSRDGLHDDYRLWRVPAGGGERRLLVDRNLASPAVSPDGRWLAFVPLDRGSEEVGIHFAMEAAGRLVLTRPSDGRQVELSLDLPGKSGFPAFSPDGRWLYFSQYLNDTDFDGRITGDDHSVLFRVPFDGKRDDPVGDATPQQLTSARWNCQYPAPAPERLLMTCAIGGSLDVYSLPPDGAVPADAEIEALRAELHAARDHWEKLLLLDRTLARTEAGPARADLLRTMARLHVELREYASAAFYAKRLGALGDPGSPLNDLSRAMGELVGSLREDAQLVEGQLSSDFLAAQRERRARLDDLIEAGGAAGQLARLVAGSIQDLVGEKGAALEHLEAVDPEEVEDPFVLHVVGDLAAQLLRPLGRRDQLLETYRILSTKRGFDELERLRYADRLTDELLRGVPRSDRPGRVEAWLERVEPESEAALMLKVRGQLLRLDHESSEDVLDGLYDIYRRLMTVDRRKALVLTTVAEALRRDDAFLAYQFANAWVSWVDEDAPERRYASALYGRIVRERAWTSLAEGKIGDARGSFFGATLITDVMEPHVGFIEARFREGREDTREVYADRWQRRPDPAARHFVEAYLLARELREASGGEAVRSIVDRAREHLAAAAEERPQSLEIHHLWATLAHERFAWTGDTRDALEAHNHYHVAVDLARERPRYRAPLLHQIGLLQAGLGNHRLAVEWLDRRLELPFVRPETELSFRLARARSLFHSERHGAAADEATRALELVDARPELAPFRPLALDRAGLYHYAAERFARARGLYEDLLPLLREADPADAGRGSNVLRARIMAGAAALAAGEPEAATAHLDEADALLVDGDLEEPEAEREASGALPTDYDPADFRILVRGLRAEALERVGDPEAATEALGEREALLSDAPPVRESLARLARTRYRLAILAAERQDDEDTRRHLEAGLRAMDRYEEETSTPITDEVLDLLQAYAELHLDRGVPRSALELDLEARLERAFEHITTHRAPDWEAHRFLFAQYLTLLALEPPSTEAAKGDAR